MPFVLWPRDDVAVRDELFCRSHFDLEAKNGLLSLAKETGGRLLGCMGTIRAKGLSRQLKLARLTR